jgi:hypothetical protein
MMTDGIYRKHIACLARNIETEERAKRAAIRRAENLKRFTQKKGEQK